jgi:hypothetical protein
MRNWLWALLLVAGCSNEQPSEALRGERDADASARRGVIASSPVRLQAA